MQLMIISFCSYIWKATLLLFFIFKKIFILYFILIQVNENMLFLLLLTCNSFHFLMQRLNSGIFFHISSTVHLLYNSRFKERGITVKSSSRKSIHIIFKKKAKLSFIFKYTSSGKQCF